MNYNKGTSYAILALALFSISMQPVNAVLSRIASQGSLIKAATGQETTTWEKIKAGLFVYVQLDDIKKLKDDTEALIKLTGDVIKSNIDTIEKIYAAQLEEDKKQTKKTGKKPANNSFWTAQLKKIKDEILALQTRTIKELTNLNLKEFIDPNTRSSFMDIISQMNDSFDKALDIIPQPIKDELFTSVKRKANSMMSNSDEDDDPLNVTTSHQIRPAAKPVTTKPLAKKGSSGNLIRSESSQWDFADQPLSKADSLIVKPLTRKQSVTNPRKNQNNSKNLNPTINPDEI